MADDFQPHTDIKWNGTVGTVQYGGGDSKLLVMFYTRPTHNPAKSTESGRPIYEDKTFVRIQVPGERFNIVDRPANVNDARRFPVQYAQFQQGAEQRPEGTPVNLLFADRPSVAAMLEASGVHTVEMLAGLSGTAIDSIGMGAQHYVNEAQKYLEMSNKGVGANKLKAELEERDRKIRSQEHEIAMLKDQINKVMETQAQTLDIATIQKMIAANNAGQRPQFPVGAPKQMAPAFDASTAQINANAPTAEVARKRKTPNKRARLSI